MKEILLNIPTQIETPRLILRGPRAGDGKEVNAAIVESFEDFRDWIPWAKALPTLEETEEKMRSLAAQWITREGFLFLVFEQASGALVACTGIHRPNWEVKCFEAGYWAKSSCVGKGFVSEAMIAVTRFAFEALGANRLELRCDPRNDKSIKVAERLGFEFEGTLRNNSTSPRTGELRDTSIYARLNTAGLPPLEIKY